MCGILGVANVPDMRTWTNTEVKRLERRGPDHQGTVHFDNILSMGVARLAMTDPLPRSNQPMMDSKTGSALSFNGEIYNYKQLRSEMEKDGTEFRTSSDTEVLLNLLLQEEEKAIQKLNGMFSFAFYNKQKNYLILARDSLGKKPLYFMCERNGNGLSWSSSIETLHRRQKNRSLDNQSIFSYLTLGYTIDPRTPYSDISAVLSGHYIKIKLPNFSINQVPFSFAGQTDPKTSLRENLELAVKDRIDNHKSVAISLSGGLDSSIVAFEASKSNTNVHGYSAVWKDSDKERYNADSINAKKFAEKIGIKFTAVEMPTTGELRKWISVFNDSMEEPNSNPTGISMACLYEAIKKDGHRLVLTGDGADEIFGGYPRYNALSKLPNILQLNCKITDKILETSRETAPSSLIKILISQSSSNNVHKWLHWHWNFTADEASNLMKSDEKQGFYSSIEEILNQSNKNNVNDLARIMSMDSNVWLNMESNRKLDRISMFNSIEARSPFEDDRLVRKARELMTKSNYKLINKEILATEYPEVTVHLKQQTKVGFVSPVGHWLRGNPDLVQESLDYLEKTFNFNLNMMTKIQQGINKGEYRRIMQTWSLVVLADWHSRVRS